MILYVDSSAAVKLVVEEPESTALADHLDDLGPDTDLLSSALLETELRRLAVRLHLPQTLVSQVLSRVSLVEPNRSICREAGILPGSGLRILDALHVATALRLDASAVLAYDRRLLGSARDLGFDVSSPS